MAVNNKEGKPLEHYLTLYRELDPIETARRCGIAFDSETGVFSLTFLGNEYSVSFPDFSVKISENAVLPNPFSMLGAAHILLVRYILEGRLVPALGKYLTYREVPWGSVYNDNFTGRCIKRLAFSFGNDIERFRAVMDALNAKPLDSGDCSYELEFMPGLFIRYILWAGDDEFPPAAQILFSDNFPSAFSAEDLAAVGDVTINTMKELKNSRGLGNVR